jgi:hypothetical protein
VVPNRAPARFPPPSVSAAERKEEESKRRKEMATYFTLNTGARIPSVGLGTYKAGPGAVGDAIAAAIKVFSTPKQPGIGTSTARPCTTTRRRLVLL